MSLAPAAHIVAFGVRTPVGLRDRSAAAAIEAGVGLVQEHPYFIDAAGEALMAAYDTKIDQALTGLERMQVFGEYCLRQFALTLPPSTLLDLPLLLALPEFRPGFAHADAVAIQHTFVGVRGPLRIRSVHVVAQGHAGALEALHEAARLVTTSEQQACLVGGIDSWLEPHAIAWLSSLRRLACEGTRSAFIPGEGACFALVVSQAMRRTLALPSLARIRGVGLASEPCSLLSGHDNLGHGLSAAVRAACAGLGEAERVGNIYCDLNGETYRAQEWGLTVLRSQAWLRDGTRYVAPADRWGDLGAATGIALAILPAAAWQRRHYPVLDPLALLFAGSDGGRRAAILLERPNP